MGTTGNAGNSISTFYCDSGQILEEVAQIGRGVFITGDIPNPTGHGPGELALTGVLGAGVRLSPEAPSNLSKSVML